ncbi:putative cyclin-F2-1 [Phragmites australis]|uniref:putative cyclin-F2-1 n=1 Tax=Phragmites australis TaxID=29695 RepID=UPI002D767B1D|nr:putative cyclin-F2-1 [Phragmites australis]
MDALDFGHLLGRRPLAPGLGSFPGGGGSAMHMDGSELPVRQLLAPGFELPVRHPLPPGLCRFCGGTMDTVTEHTNPFSFGLDLACLPPHGFGPFSGGDAVHAEQMDAFTLELLDRPLTTGFGPFSGGGAGKIEHTNPFSFGLDLAPPPLTGFGPFSGGAGMRTEQKNPFTIEVLDDDLPLPMGCFGPFSPGAAEHTGPMEVDDYLRAIGALPSPPPAGFPRVYGNPFADGTSLTMDRPAAWDLYHGHVQPFVEVPVPLPAPTAPASDRANIKNSKTRPAEPYDDDIDATLRAMEKDAKERPSSDYLETTQEGRINPRRRASLVRWMGRFSRRYDLAPGTLHSTVSYVDRFLSSRPLITVSRQQLRLLGAAAVYAAAKYEDQGTTQKLNSKEIALRCGKHTTGQDVLDMERELLAALDYRLGRPTACTFVGHFTRSYSQGEEDLEVQHTAHYLADISLLDYGCLKLRPSVVAAAAIFLARLTLKPSYGQVRRWNRDLKELTGYRPKDLKYGVESMCSLMRKRDRSFDVVTFPVFYADPS